MDKELIERLAREAGVWIDGTTMCMKVGEAQDRTRRFAALIAEECAKDLDRHGEAWGKWPSGMPKAEAARFLAYLLRSKYC